MKVILLLLTLLTLASVPAAADDRRPRDDRRGVPFSASERWHGSRTWRPDRETRRSRSLPDRFTVDRHGNCEVICTLVRTTGEYKCREYKCE